MSARVILTDDADAAGGTLDAITSVAWPPLSNCTLDPAAVWRSPGQENTE